MKHKIKMNIFSLETTVNFRLSTPRAAYLFETHWGGGGGLSRNGGLI